MITRRYVVSGQVQGVGFRWFTARTARRLGVSGFVKNLEDGRVEVVARGTAAMLEELGTALAKGPPAARVAAVDTMEIGGDPSDAGPFAIK